LLIGWLEGINSLLSGDEMNTMRIRYYLVMEIVVNVVSLFREKGVSAEKYLGSPEAIIEEVLNIKSPKSMHEWTENFLIKCHEALHK